MSKIGKINIAIPEKVKVTINGHNLLMEGPLGKNNLSVDVNLFDLDVKEGKEVSIKPKIVNQSTKRIWGLNRSLINNAIKGINEGYSKTLELSGVGFRAAIKGNMLNLQIGFSHDVNYQIPEGIKIVVEKQTTIKITGSDKQLVGSVAAKIKSFKKTEPYKGKEIKEAGEYILRKRRKKEIMKLTTKNRKKFRVRNKLKRNNPNNRMRLSVSRSSKNISAQIIDDKNNKTLISATANMKILKDRKKKKTELSELVATKLAEKAKEKNITKVYFDRSIYKYHGRIKIFAETLRKNGLEF